MSAARANASLQLPCRHLGAAGRASGGEADNSLMKRGEGVKVSFAETEASVAPAPPAVVSVAAVAGPDEVDVGSVTRP